MRRKLGVSSSDKEIVPILSNQPKTLDLNHGQGIVSELESIESVGRSSVN